MSALKLCTMMVLICALSAGSYAPLANAAPDTARTSTTLYRINVNLDPDGRRMSVVTDITLPRIIEPRAALEFALRRDMGAPSVEALTAGLGVAGVEQAPDQTSVNSDSNAVLWRVAFTHPPIRGRPTRLRIRSSGEATASLNFWLGPDFAVAGGGSTPWYPQVAGGRGEGSLSISVPRRYFLVATGTRRGERVDGQTRTASFAMNHSTQFGFVASLHQPLRVEGPTPVSVYASDTFVQRSQLAHVAQRVINVLQHDFGPYPFAEFAVIEAPTQAGEQSGFLGAAFDGFMVMRSDFLETKGADLGFFGHEIGHQWWGVAVTSAGRGGEYMLDEALANYGALRAVEALGQPEDARRFRAGLDGLGGARHAARLIEAGFDAPLSDLPHAPGYYGLSDSKGYLAYDMLARLIGRDHLAAALTELYRQHAFAEIDWATFETRLRREAGPEQSWFFDQWFHRTGLPTLSYQWRASANTAIIDVQQAPPIFQFELPIRITLADGATVMRSVLVSQAHDQATFSFDRRIANVELDPLRTQLWTTPTDRALARTLAPITRGRLLWDNGDTPGAIVEFQSALRQEAAEPTAATFDAHVYLGWIAEQRQAPDEALVHYRRAISSPVRDSELAPRAYYNLARILATRGDGAGARDAARAAVAAERDAGVHTRISDRSEAIAQQFSASP
ncbi:MAG: hypothetical protein WAU68_08445 [Vitreimonas sp.]